MEVKGEAIQRENRENRVPPNFYLSELTHTQAEKGLLLKFQHSDKKKKKSGFYNLFYKLVAEQLVETSSFTTGCQLSHAACLPKI